MQVQLKVANGNKAGQIITINRPRFLIGRADDCHLKPKSELISRYHCAILSEDGYVAARDLGSKNGVFVNGRRITIEEELKNGDHLVIGPLDFEVILSVTLAAEKKPKVASVGEVVARTVERDSSTPTKAVAANDSSDAEGTLADWLLDDEDEGAGKDSSTRTLQAEQLAEIGLTPEDQDQAKKLLNMKGDKKKAETTKTVNDAKPETPAVEDPDAAANLLKSFFQGH